MVVIDKINYRILFTGAWNYVEKQCITQRTGTPKYKFMFLYLLPPKIKALVGVIEKCISILISICS